MTVDEGQLIKRQRTESSDESLSCTNSPTLMVPRATLNNFLLVEETQWPPSTVHEVENASSNIKNETPNAGKRFTVEEDRLIVDGVAKYGSGDWQRIISEGNLPRNVKQVKGRYDRILKHSAKNSKSESSGDADYAPPSTAENTPVKLHQPQINEYFLLAEHKHDQSVEPEATHNEHDNDQDDRLLMLRGKVLTLETTVANLRKEARRVGDENALVVADYESQILCIQRQIQSRQVNVRRALEEMVIKQSDQEYRKSRQEASDRSLKLGVLELLELRQRNFAIDSTKPSAGWMMQDLRARLSQITLKRDEIEVKRKSISKLKQSRDLDSNSTNQSSKGTRVNGSAQLTYIPSSADLYQEEETLKVRMAALKKEELSVSSDINQLEQEQDLHIRELKRMRGEDNCRFKRNTILKDRYIIVKLIGRGGFSEVLMAYDLQECRHVACKIHSLNTQWSHDRKTNFIRHTVREFRIHRSLNHPQVVEFYDLFEIDANTFCVVLEYCEGGDLDVHVRSNRTYINRCVPEKEARVIMLQVFNALRYFNQIQPPIIHYDLKPGNILLMDGCVKITDFGLSKIMHSEQVQNESHGVELTSQGAGTYWYLPPECFSRGREPPKISSKVDVWSAGVIFFQLLYGVKPFGNDQSQQVILSENTIVATATTVNFPSKPAVSSEAKDFIRRCLEYRKDIRPDVLTLCNDPYLQPSGRSKLLKTEG